MVAFAASGAPALGAYGDILLKIEKVPFIPLVAKFAVIGCESYSE